MLDGTVEHAWRNGWVARMSCEQGGRRGFVKIQKCRFAGELDLRTLVCTRGRAFPLDMLQSRLRCPDCGSAKISLFFMPPAKERTAFAAAGE